MITQFFSLGLIVLLGAMLPGPDFAIVTKNTLLHSRRSGLWTTFGVSCAILVHMSYCVLGLAWVITQSLLFFSLIKYLGALYLIHLGMQSLMSKQAQAWAPHVHKSTSKTQISKAQSFRQGFLCNLLNPKATLFFLAIFTVIIKPNTPLVWKIIYTLEIFCITLLWFSSLTWILSHARVKKMLEKAEKYLAKILGVCLIGFGIALAIVGR